jgi:hypothetical protein
MFRIIDSFLEIKIPKPELATHAIDQKSALWNLDKGYLMKPFPDYPISFSLNRHVWGKPELFVFNLDSLIKEYAMAPVIYLFSKSWAISYHDPKYQIYSWDFFPFVEIVSYDNISLKHLKYIVPKSKEVYDLAIKKGYPISSELEKTPFSETIEYWHRKLVHYISVEMVENPPPPHFANFLHSYNRMICEIFKIDYENVKEEARREAFSDPEHYGPVWW